MDGGHFLLADSALIVGRYLLGRHFKNPDAFAVFAVVCRVQKAVMRAGVEPRLAAAAHLCDVHLAISQIALE